MPIQKAIATAVATFRKSPELDDESVFRVLLNAGIEKRLAAGAVELIPSAYCRVLLRGSGVRFSEMFVRGSSGSTQLLTTHPVWSEGLAYAERENESGIPREDFLLVARRSAEYQVINELLGNGGAFRNIVLTEILLQWPEDGP